MDILIEGCTLSFPELFKPKAFAGSDKSAYSATFILDPEKQAAEIAKLKNVIAEVAKARWADRYQDVLKQLKAQGRLCLRSGDEKAGYAGFAGNLFVSASSKNPPKVYDRDPKFMVEAHHGKIYAGAIVNAGLSIWAQDSEFGKRINATLLGVQFVDAGTKLASVSEVSESFFPTLSMATAPLVGDSGSASDAAAALF